MSSRIAKVFIAAGSALLFGTFGYLLHKKIKEMDEKKNNSDSESELESDQDNELNNEENEKDTNFAERMKNLDEDSVNPTGPICPTGLTGPQLQQLDDLNNEEDDLNNEEDDW